MISPLDDFSFDGTVAAGDKLLKEESSRQLDSLFEARCVESILKHHKVPLKEAFKHSREKFASEYMQLSCIREILPHLPLFSAYRFDSKVKKINTLSYEWLAKSQLGEAVTLFGADKEGYWLMTDIQMIPGIVVVGVRSFPLERPVSGYIAAENEGSKCFVISPVQLFLSSDYCRSSAHMRSR